ncbi:MAG: hypothetical protein EXR70_13740 [Deltaproteobacteria bacterium]|nr:hypothetical protein [Deltaproteobacteria bacterium]
MFKRPYILAIVSFLLIPTVAVLGGILVLSINPEIAAGRANYERNYWLLSLAQSISMWAVLLVVVGLWFLTCFFLLKSKNRSYGWLLPLAVLGPFGLMILTMLNDTAPAPGDLYQQFVGKLKSYLRVAYELGFFVVLWVGAFLAMVLTRDLMIMYEAATTGISAEQIIKLQNDSSGMWALSEGLEVLFLVVLFYLLWPICFNVVGRLRGLWTSAKKV